MRLRAPAVLQGDHDALLSRRQGPDLDHGPGMLAGTVAGYCGMGTCQSRDSPSDGGRDDQFYK